MTEYWVGLNRNSEIRTNYPIKDLHYVESFNVEEVIGDDLCLLNIKVNMMNVSTTSFNNVHYTLPSSTQQEIQFYGQVLNEEDMDILEKLEKL